MVDDIVREFGHLTLGSRLKRLGERMQADVARAMEEAGVGLATSLPPLLAALDRHGPLTVNELAGAVGVSQPGVTRSLGKLEADGWIETKRLDRDRRSKMVELTPSGQRLIDRSRSEFWPYLEIAVAHLCTDLQGPFLQQLATIENRLARSPLDQRIAETRKERA